MSSQAQWPNRAKLTALLYGLALVVLFGRQWWGIVAYNVMPCTECKSDFLSLYTGASLLWNDPQSVYDLEKQKSFQLLVQPEQGDWVLPFLNPPFAAVLLLPLAWFSFQTAYFVMAVANVLLLVLSLWLLIRRLGLSSDQAHWLLLFAVANIGTHVAFFQGQTSFILLFVLTCFFTAKEEGSEIKAGIFASLAWFKPQIGAVILGFTSIPVRWRRIWPSLTSLSLFAASSLLIVGAKGTLDFLSLMQQAMQGTNGLGINPDRMHNLRALSMYVLPQPWAIYLWIALTVVAGLITIKLCLEKTARLDFVGRSFWIMVAVLLVAPHLHTHDLAVVIIPAAFFLRQCDKNVSALSVLFIMSLAVLPFLNLISLRPTPPFLPIGLLIILIFGRGRALKAFQKSAEAC